MDLRFNIHLRTGFPIASQFGPYDVSHALNTRVTRSWRRGGRTRANTRIACYGRINAGGVEFLLRINWLSTLINVDQPRRLHGASRANKAKEKSKRASRARVRVRARERNSTAVSFSLFPSSSLSPPLALPVHSLSLFHLVNTRVTFNYGPANLPT